MASRTFASASRSWREDRAERVGRRRPGRSARRRARRRSSASGSGVSADLRIASVSEEARGVLRRGRGGGVGEPAVAVDRPAERRPMRRRPSARRRRPGSRPAPAARRAGPAARGPSSSSCSAIEPAPRRSAGTPGPRSAGRRPTDASGPPPSTPASAGSTPSQHAEAAQRPQGMDRRRRSGRWRRRDVSCSMSVSEVVRDVRLAPLDEQPLGVQPPEHVVALQRRDEPLRVVLRQLRLLASASRPSRRSGRSGRASCRAAASRTRRPCRSCTPRASGCAGR